MSMKFLLVLAVLVVAFWVWRNNRQSGEAPEQPKRREPGLPLPMIACDLCGTHLPDGEALDIWLFASLNLITIGDNERVCAIRGRPLSDDCN